MAKPTEVAVARLLKPHGLHGEIAAKLLTDNPDRVSAGSTFLLSPHISGIERIVVKDVRPKKDVLLLSLEGVTDRVSAGRFSNATLMLRIEDLPALEPNVYYHHDLIGMRVATSEGREIGVLEEVLETGANDVYVVRDGTSEVLVPAIESVVKSVDTGSGMMTIEPLPGLLPEDSDED